MFLTANRKQNSFEEVIALLDERGASPLGGIYVNGTNSLAQSTVWACAKLHSEIIASLPIEVQEKNGNQWVTVEDHQINELLANPNDFQTQHDLLSFLVLWSELAGNAYLMKAKSSDGAVRYVYPIQSGEVNPKQLKNWKVTYDVANLQISGQFDKEKIFHLRNFGSEGFVGLSTIENHKKSVGLALRLQDHAESIYKKGLINSKWLELETLPSDPKKLAELEARLSKYKGAENSGELPIISKGKFHEFNRMSAVDAQYIESRNLQKQEIASIFGIPMFLLNDTEKSTTWGTGLEQISRAFIRFSLNPRLSRLSQTFVREFIPENKRLRTRVVFDTDQFTLGDFKERMEGYRSGIESGVLNPNECREMEGRNARENGDDYRIPMNTAIEGEQNQDSQSLEL